MGRLEKQKKMRDLLCFAIEALLEHKCINLDYSSDEDRGNSVENILQTNLLNKETIICWRGVGFGEIEISVWWGYDSKRPITFTNLRDKKNKNAQVRCSGILERKDGKWLHGFGGENIFNNYCSRVAAEELSNIPVAMFKKFKREGVIL